MSPEKVKGLSNQEWCALKQRAPDPLLMNVDQKLAACRLMDEFQALEFIVRQTAAREHIKSDAGLGSTYLGLTTNSKMVVCMVFRSEADEVGCNTIYTVPLKF